MHICLYMYIHLHHLMNVKTGLSAIMWNISFQQTCKSQITRNTCDYYGLHSYLSTGSDGPFSVHIRHIFYSDVNVLLSVCYIYYTFLVYLLLFLHQSTYVYVCILIYACKYVCVCICMRMCKCLSVRVWGYRHIFYSDVSVLLSVCWCINIYIYMHRCMIIYTYIYIIL